MSSLSQAQFPAGDKSARCIHRDPQIGGWVKIMCNGNRPPIAALDSLNRWITHMVLNRLFQKRPIGLIPIAWDTKVLGVLTEGVLEPPWVDEHMR